MSNPFSKPDHPTWFEKWGGTTLTVVCWAVALVALSLGLWFVSCEPGTARGESPYDVGDSCYVMVAPRDSIGAIDLPDAARIYVIRDGVIVDSSLSYPGGGLTMIASSGSKAKNLIGRYIIPSATGTFPIDLHFVCKYTMDGFIDDDAPCSPQTIRVNPIIEHVELVDLTTTTTNVTEEILATIAALDSITPNGIDDINRGDINENYATLDSTSCTPCGVYTQAGDPAPSGHVWITDTPILRVVNPGRNVRKETRVSTPGYWSIGIPLDHGRPDTVWVWTWSGFDFPTQGEQVIIPELD